MAFDNNYPNRKDWRLPYKKKAQRVDRSCRCGGSCSWCQGNRTHKNAKRMLDVV